MNDYIDLGLDELQRSIKELDKKFEQLDQKVKDELAKQVVAEAGQLFLAEQKRLLATAPNPKMRKFANSLKVWTRQTKSGWQVNVGYPAEMFSETGNGKENLEVFIYEFGRPGVRGKKKGGRDSLGRKIGKIEQYSVIRASLALKKEAVMKEVEQRFYEELGKEWDR